MDLTSLSMAGKRRVRLRRWSDRTYARMDLFEEPGGTFIRGPWLTIFDQYGRNALRLGAEERGEAYEDKPFKALSFGFPDDGTAEWEEYVGPRDPLDVDDR